MSKEEKIIKDLKERNRSLKNQFRLRDIRVNILEQREIEKDKEIERLNNIINESAEEILKELEENNHLSYGVALTIRQKLLDYKELRGSEKE